MHTRVLALRTPIFTDSPTFSVTCESTEHAALGAGGFGENHLQRISKPPHLWENTPGTEARDRWFCTFMPLGDSTGQSGTQLSPTLGRAQIPQPQAAVNWYFHEIQQKLFTRKKKFKPQGSIKYKSQLFIIRFNRQCPIALKGGPLNACLQAPHLS